MPSSTVHDYLANAIDEYTEWFLAWHRLAFIDCEQRASKISDLAIPKGFLLWHKNTASTVYNDQPAIEKLILIHDQLHTLSRLVLLRTPDQQVIAQDDYTNVMKKYREFVQGVRRLESAFSTAASKLDVLTGLRSRFGLREELERELERCRRNGKKFCLAIMDIDHFKKVNDTFGHTAGDSVLVAIANHISRGMRIFDDAYRLGGEEFLLCFKETDQAMGLSILERLRSDLEKSPVLLDNGETLVVTASFGLIVSQLDMTVDDMINRADKALYLAKENGRNCIKVDS